VQAAQSGRQRRHAQGAQPSEKGSELRRLGEIERLIVSLHRLQAKGTLLDGSCEGSDSREWEEGLAKRAGTDDCPDCQPCGQLLLGSNAHRVANIGPGSLAVQCGERTLAGHHTKTSQPPPCETTDICATNRHLRRLLDNFLGAL
jgi:hypothetical protein